MLSNKQKTRQILYNTSYTSVPTTVFGKWQLSRVLNLYFVYLQILSSKPSVVSLSLQLSVAVKYLSPAEDRNSTPFCCMSRLRLCLRCTRRRSI